MLGFRPSYDCTQKVCGFGNAWGDQPHPNSTVDKPTTDKAHGMKECSNMGICNREEGYCECFTGYRGSTCNKKSCPGKGDCSGHGKCVSMMLQTRMPHAMPLTNANNKTTSGYYEPGGHQGSTWDSTRLFGCVCDSSWPVGLGVGETQQAEVRLDEEQSDSKSVAPHSYITNDLRLVASLLVSPLIPILFMIRFARRSGLAPIAVSRGAPRGTIPAQTHLTRRTDLE
jgi:hypothetical protein